MRLKIFFFAILTVLVLVLQISFFGSFSWLWLNLDLAAAVLVFLIFLAAPEISLLFALSAGLVLDIYSGLPFGIFLFSWLLTWLVLIFLSLNLFTNRSFYVLLILGLIAVAAQAGFFCLFAGALYLFGLNEFLPDRHYFFIFLSRLATNSLLLILGFKSLNLWSRYFKPIFLYDQKRSAVFFD